MSYEATPTVARAWSAVRDSEALRVAWRVFWPTRMAVLLVAIFAALSLGPVAGRRRLLRRTHRPLGLGGALWRRRRGHPQRRAAAARAARRAVVVCAAAAAARPRLARARAARGRRLRALPRAGRGRRAA